MTHDPMCEPQPTPRRQYAIGVVNTQPRSRNPFARVASPSFKLDEVRAQVDQANETMRSMELIEVYVVLTRMEPQWEELV